MKEKKFENYDYFDWDDIKEKTVAAWTPCCATIAITCGALALMRDTLPLDSPLLLTLTGLCITAVCDGCAFILVLCIDDDNAYVPPLSSVIALGMANIGVGVHNCLANISCNIGYGANRIGSGIKSIKNKLSSKKKLKENTANLENSIAIEDSMAK